MTKNAKSLRAFFRRQYIAGFILLGLLIGASSIVFLHQGQQQSGRADLISLASSQKALSQRIAYFVNAYANAPAGEDTTLRAAELQSTVNTMRDAHELLSGQTQGTEYIHSHIKGLHDIYFNDISPFNSDVTLFLESAEKILKTDDPAAMDILLQEINILGTQTIMQTHDVMVRILTHEAEQSILRTQALGFILMIAIIALLMAEIWLIFEPMGARIEHSMRQAENSEAHAQAEAERANQANAAKTTFLRLMSHELRTPLNAVIGMSRLLKETELAPKQTSYANHIEDAGQHMLSIADDIVTINSHNTGEMTLNTKPARLSNEINDALEIMRPRASDKNLSLAFCNGIKGEDVFAVDTARLRQVLYNLIGNAIKFTETGSVQITTHAAPQKDGGTKVTMRFEDTGIGVAEENRDFIFEEFNQTHLLGKRQHGGAGLGLPICRRIARAMGGDITLVETSPEGSVFEFTAILDRASLSDRNGSSSDKSAATSEKILVVDDSLPNRMIAAAYLKKAGFKIAFAENGEEALAAVDKEGDVSLIIMDIEMPVMDGITATKSLRRDDDMAKAKMPIIALTAHALPEDRDNLLSEGFNEVLRKPTNEKELVSQTRRYLELAA